MTRARTKPVPQPATLQELLGAEMAAVEERLDVVLESKEPRLSEIARYLIGAGGKRVRPLVAMALFRATGGQDPRDMIDVAVALELIHSATLLHDDIIDGGEVRRGKPSAYVVYGAADTLVAGDFLFSRAFELCGRFDEHVVRWASEACVALTEGEILQGRLRRNPAVTVEDYREIIFRKTASIFQVGAKVSAHLAKGKAGVVDGMARCGRAIGMAFQVVDDLLDVTGETAATGKPVGIDLRDGNPSLPIVLALASSPLLTRIWTKKDASDAEIETALAELRRSGVVGRVRHEALSYTRAAAAELELLPANPYRTSLETLVHDLSERAT